MPLTLHTLYRAVKRRLRKRDDSNVFIKELIFHRPPAHNSSSDNHSLHINLMQPNLLLLSRRVRTDPQNILHLMITHKQNRSSNKPLHALLARRTRQTTLVRPKLIDHVDFLQRQTVINLRAFILHRRIEANHLRQLCKKSRVVRPGVEAESKDGAILALCVDVDEVHFRFGTVAADGVVCGRVDVPAFQVDGFVVEEHVREGGVVVFGVVEREAGSVAPVEEVSGHVAAGVAGEGDVGAFGKALV